jgi:hypothetical protein
MSNIHLTHPARLPLWTAVSLGSVAALSILLLTCCANRKVVIGPAQRLPEPEQIVLPVPAAVHAAAGEVTETAMENILLHVDDDIRLDVRHLRGRMEDLTGEHVIVLDDKHRLELQIAFGELGLTSEGLTLLLNRYVFGYRGSPLKNLLVRTEGDHIVQTGTMHKIIDIPFEMTAELSVTPAGLIRIHPIRMDICGLDGQKLLAAVGRTLEDLLDLSGARGVKVDGNDLLLDPLANLPPPRTTGRLTAVRVEGDEVIQVFGSPDAPGTEPLTLPVAARNYAYFRGGTIRFGKLYMVESDLLAIDTDDSDPFDFYLDYYHTQLVAGYHVTSPDYGLIAHMPDFDDIGTPAGRVELPRSAEKRPSADGGRPENPPMNVLMRALTTSQRR